MEPESRMQVIASRNNADSISMLPDLIIGEILSLIPTKQAVATSILSKRWKYLWTLVKNLDFFFRKRKVWWKEEDGMKDDTTFVKFVDRVLSMCKTQGLHRLYLDTDCCGTHIRRWINKALIRNVQILNLQVSEFPGNVFTCSSLTSIESYVGLENVTDIPDSFYLPKLKVLHVYFPSKSIGLAEKLVSCCPALEEFIMKGQLGFQTTFVISLPLLKRLIIRTIPYGSGQSEYTLEIDAPQLRFLDIYTRAHVPSYVIKNVGSEVEVIIDFGEVTEKGSLCIVELLKQLIEVKSLKLGSLTFRGLSNVDVLKKLPVFNKLTLLKLEMGRFYSWEIMSHLLQSSPSLEVLTVGMYFDLNDVEHLEFHWIEPQNVPPCLSSRLRVVEIYSIFQEDVEQELEMVKYFLGNGKMLQKFIVGARVRVGEKAEFCEKLLTFPRASRDCEVHMSSSTWKRI